MPDLFIAHASEDKDEFARPLAAALRERGLDVWYDEYSLRLGDSLAREIDRGLAATRFGIVLLSPHFFAKEWPQKELDGLLARETIEGTKRVLPVWHDVGVTEVARFSPTLAGRVAIVSSKGMTAVVQAIMAAIEPSQVQNRQVGTREVPASTASVNVPTGYERKLNLHRFRIAKDTASRSEKGGYEYPVAVRGLQANIRVFVAAAVKNGATAVGSVTAGSLSTASFNYTGPNGPELFEALAISAGVQVLECGKPVAM